MPWQRDPVTGDWYRADKPYHRGDGVVVDKVTAPSALAYLSQGRDQVRTVINRVKLSGGAAGRGGRRQDIDTVTSRRSIDGSVKMGGGFVYRSNIAIDLSRPTPSRPTYSHGLFLFPFSNEEASRMLNSSAGEHAPATREHAGAPKHHEPVLLHAQPERDSSTSSSRNPSWLDLPPQERQDRDVLHRDVVREDPAPGPRARVFGVRPSDLRKPTPPERQRR